MVVGVVAVVAILYIVLAGRKEKEVLTEETVIEEGEEKPRVPLPKVETDLTGMRGIGPKRSEKPKTAGTNSIENLVRYRSKELAHEVGVPEKTAFKWIENANEILVLKSIDRSARAQEPVDLCIRGRNASFSRHNTH
ncbi:MAG: hypothetical protein NWE76_04330, partial [Candidatus Bathyarchaeota archaeon]|nr:hypothetical protein [Candidatus Bathyarchaeota archaeon]